MARFMLLRLLESYFRRPILYLLPIVLMAALAGAYLYYQPPEYAARGTLLVQKQTLLATLVPLGERGTWRTPAQLTLAELSELVQTDAFVRAVIQKTALEPYLVASPEGERETLLRYREAIWMRALGDNLVQIGATDENPQAAQQLVAQTLAAYIDWKLNADRQESVVAQEFFSQLLPGYEAALQSARDNLNAFLQQYPDPLRGNRPTNEQIRLRELQAVVDQAADQVKATREKEESARLALSKAESDARQNYLVVDAPALPIKPDRTLRAIVRDAAIFLGVGLLLSMGGVLASAILDRRFRLPIDVRQRLNLPVLALVPEVRAGKGSVAIRDEPAPAEPAAERQLEPTVELKQRVKV